MANRKIFRYHLGVLILILLIPMFNDIKAIPAALFIFFLHSFSSFLGALYFKTRTTLSFKKDILISSFIVFFATDMMTYYIGIQDCFLFNIMQNGSSILGSTCILMIVSFSGSLIYCFSDENDFASPDNVLIIFITLALLILASGYYILGYLQNRRAITPINWIEESGRSIVNSSFGGGRFFKYAHPTDWVETHVSVKPFISSADIFIFDLYKSNLKEENRQLIPQNGLFFYADELFDPHGYEYINTPIGTVNNGLDKIETIKYAHENTLIETRIFRTITTDSTEFISKKQKKIELNGDQFTQYDLETSKTITKQFYCQKNGKHILCSFWATDKQLFKQKEAVIDSIANTFYLSSF